MKQRFGQELLEQEKDKAVHLIQLWFNPGVGLGRENEKSEVVLLDENVIPKVNLKEIGNGSGSGTARVLIGEFQGEKSPAKTWDAKILLLHCYLEKDCNVSIDLPDEEFTSVWVYSLRGSENDLIVGTDADGEVCKPQELKLVNNNDSNITKSTTPGGTRIHLKTLKTSEGGSVHFLLGAGKPFWNPWFKLLGHDGALIGPTESFVRTKMKEFEKNPEKFDTTS